MTAEIIELRDRGRTVPATTATADDDERPLTLWELLERAGKSPANHQNIDRQIAALEAKLVSTFLEISNELGRLRRLRGQT